MSAESDFAVGFGEPDTYTDTGGLRTASAHTVLHPPAPVIGIAAHNRPDAPGWSSAATAIHSMRKMDLPVLLLLEAPGLHPVALDFGHNTYFWDRPIELLPVEPDSVAVYTQPVVAGEEPLCGVPGHSLDSLLWLIGLNSFAGALAWWLPDTERYHMTRWPNLTELAHTSSQMRMIAMLGNAYFGPIELARISATSITDSQRLLNALSLMGVLQSSSTTPEPQPRVEVSHGHGGLFRRLLDRLANHG